MTEPQAQAEARAITNEHKSNPSNQYSDEEEFELVLDRNDQGICAPPHGEANVTPPKSPTDEIVSIELNRSGWYDTKESEPAHNAHLQRIPKDDNAKDGGARSIDSQNVHDKPAAGPPLPVTGSNKIDATKSKAKAESKGGKKKSKKSKKPTDPVDELALTIPATRYQTNAKGKEIETRIYRNYKKNRAKVQSQQGLEQDKAEDNQPVSVSHDAELAAAKRKNSSPRSRQLYLADEPISQADPYFAKGCQRRMAFESDPVPSEIQYSVPTSQTVGPAEDSVCLNAVTKFFQWCESRPSSTAKLRDPSLEAHYLDSKTPRHFVLKIGAPNGPYGDPDILAMKLESTYKLFLRTRLQKSHITIETEIPYHHLAGKDYFKKYMQTLLRFTDLKVLGKRISIRLGQKSTEQLLSAAPEAFYRHVDADAEWRSKTPDNDGGRKWILTSLNMGGEDIRDLQGRIRRPTQEELAQAKDWFMRQKADEALGGQLEVMEALDNTKVLIHTIQRFEASKSCAHVQTDEVAAAVPAAHHEESAGASTRTPQRCFEHVKTLRTPQAPSDYSLISPESIRKPMSSAFEYQPLNSPQPQPQTSTTTGTMEAPAHIFGHELVPPQASACVKRRRSGVAHDEECSPPKRNKTYDN